VQLAEEFLDVALDMKIALLGDDHPDTAAVRGSLAYLLGFQGRLFEAVQLYNKAIMCMDAFYGPESSHAQPLRDKLKVLEEQRNPTFSEPSLVSESVSTQKHRVNR
jgi:Tetratricopeptide repeat